MTCRSALAPTVGTLLLTMSVAAAQNTATSWLDRTLTPWNITGAPIPGAPTTDETNNSIVEPLPVDAATIDRG